MAVPAVAAPPSDADHRPVVATAPGKLAGFSIPTPAWGLTATAGLGDHAVHPPGPRAPQPLRRAGMRAA